MKRDYTDRESNQERNIFTKHHHLHPHFHHQQPPPPPHHHPTPSEEEADSNNFHVLPQPPPPPNDGASIELAGRRPRGRPPGSKNKPKPPVTITQAPLTNPKDPPMNPYVLELPPGVDIVETTARFCRKRDVGLCVLSGNGAVTNVTLKQPSPAGATVTFHGKFDVLSMSATVLPRDDGSRRGFTVSLAGPQGQVVGGHVVGPLMSAATVYLIAASFNNPTYHRLGEVDEGAAAGGGDDGHGSPPHAAVSGGDSGAPAAGVSGGGGVGHVFGSYQPSDVIWAPTARQPPPSPSPPY